MRKPNLFIVGAPKTGTSALHKSLRQHPDVFMSQPKELRFFCKDLVEEHDAFYRNHRPFLKRHEYYPIRNESAYLEAFAGWGEEKIAGESSPSYMYSRVAAQEIHNFCPDAKIVAIVRNPVHFLHSLHAYILASGHETVADFRRALSLEKERKQGRELPGYSLLSQPSALFYSERAKFSKQLKRYYDLFGREAVKVIVYEEFSENNAAVYRDLLDFLGVDPTFTPDFKQVNVYRRVRFRQLNILFESSFFIKYVWSIPRTILLKAWYADLRRLFYDRFLWKMGDRPPMDPELRRELMKQYQPEVEKLSRLLDRDLVAFWGYENFK